MVFKSAQLPGLVAYKSFELGVLAVKVAVVFSGRAMPCTSLVDVIASVEAVFAVHFGKPISGSSPFRLWAKVLML